MLRFQSIYLILIVNNCLTGAISLMSSEIDGVNCDEYVNDFHVIQQFPFPVMINPDDIFFDGSYLRTSPNDNQSIAEIYITNEALLPPSFVCFRNLIQIVIYETPLNNNRIPDQLAEMTKLRNFLAYNIPIVYVTDRLSRMTQLEMFTCFNCSLKSLPDFSHLHQLWLVNVPHNQLKELHGLQNLLMLNIQSNQFEEIPSIANKTQPVFLTLSNNPLKSIQSIWSYPNLEGFDVAHMGLETLPIKIDQLKHLKHIDVSNNKLTYLPRTILNLEKLQTLDIHNNAFSDREIEAIRENFKTYRSQIELIIESNSSNKNI